MRTSGITLFGAATSVLLAGCMFGSLQSDLDEMEAHAQISGEITVEEWRESPIVVGVLKLAAVDGAPDHPFDKAELRGPGEYYFILPPGRYRVVAYEDANSNFIWDEDEGERIAAYNGFRAFEVRVAEQRAHVDIRITDRPIRNVPEIADEELQRRDHAVGTTIALSDPRFGPESGPKGLWEPMGFLDDPGWGVFMLQEYDESKVPVLFVHGISGYPQEFTHLVGGLDQDRFQPWVVQYPSGFELGIVADAINRALNELHHERQFEHMCLVAHSMGGVLSRMFLKSHREDAAARVHTFVTIDSPLGGMASAGMGASSAPVVVPSWRDLDPTGQTIPGLYDTPLPEGLEYHLFFGHTDGESDGVVSLASQLRAEAMAEAVDMHGFSATHTGVLRSDETSAHLNAALANCGAARTAPAAAAAQEAATSGGEAPADE